MATAVWPFGKGLVGQQSNATVIWVILGLFVSVAIAEFVTSAEYVFSYLYIGPILLANLRFNRQVAAWLTGLASFLVLFNLWVPGSHIITAHTISNRLVAVAALLVTELLSYRNRCYEEALAHQRTRLQIQEKLANLRQDFVSTLTHDLKTPLLGAIETITVFQQDRFGPVTPGQHKVLATMQRSHQTSLQLVETVLDIYRNDSEGVALNRSLCNLGELIEQAVESLSDLAGRYHVSVHSSLGQISSSDRWTYLDTFQVSRVLSNLLVNAINHSPTNGRVDIRLSLRVRDDLTEYLIEVQDEGPGIHTEELPQLFERFFQGHSDRQAKGAGLGLYLSRQIVEAHRGTIWAQNRAPRGAIFGFCLPRVSVDG